MRYRGIYLLVLLCMLCGSPVRASEDTTCTAPLQMECTAYCYGEITASGQPVREGIAAAKKEWIGLTAILYEDEEGSIGDIIGIYELLDTGGDERIKAGECIDLYIPDKEACLEWGRRKVWVQLVDACG